MKFIQVTRKVNTKAGPVYVDSFVNARLLAEVEGTADGRIVLHVRGGPFEGVEVVRARTVDQFVVATEGYEYEDE